VFKAEDFTLATQTIDIRVASNGRMVLPASVRKAMGLHGDAKVILTIEDDQVRLSPIGHGVSRAQALYREHAKHARTTDDFLNDRKVEAAADLGEAASGDEDQDVQ
jgi:AbrB family looped-hinge helix DNA binding protein